MNPSLLIVITLDPRRSARPAEAVRIAAGVGTWKRVNIGLYLRDAAILILSEDAEEFVDGTHFRRYLPLIRDSGNGIYVQASSPFLDEIDPSVVPYQAVSTQELGILSAQNDYVVSF